MTLYLDASVLVPLLVDEESSAAVLDFLRDADDGLAVSDLAVGEVVATVHRHIREGRYRLKVGERVLLDFDAWRAADCTATAIMAEDVTAAVAMVRRYDLRLRMPDAIHLAAARRGGMILITRDRRLLRAAMALNLAAKEPS